MTARAITLRPAVELTKSRSSSRSSCTPLARAVSTSSPGPLNRWKLLEALRSVDEGARAVDGVDWMLGARLKW